MQVANSPLEREQDGRTLPAEYLTARSHLYTQVAKMPLEREQDGRTLPAEYLTARSHLCRVANMPLKHADMSVSRAATHSPLGLKDDQYYFVLRSLHKVLPSTTSYYKACTKYFPALLRTTKLAQSTFHVYFILQSLQKVNPSKLAQSTFHVYFILQSLHKALPSTSLYDKACTKYFPALLRTTKLAQVLSSTTSYYKACTKYFPALLRTTKLAQSTFHVYFILQSLQKDAKSTSQSACAKYFPCLLHATKLAQSTSQYYFVRQSLHKALSITTSYDKACTKHFPLLLRTQSLHKPLPSTTSYYRACTKYFPVLLYTTMLAQSTSQYYTTKFAQSTSQHYFVLQSLHKALSSTIFYYRISVYPHALPKS